MSTASSPVDSSPDEPATVARLRSAGCVFAEDEAKLLLATARNPAELAAMVDRRVAGLPLEHVVGWAEFYGLRIAVDPGVFVPRRRTEFLTHQAVIIAGRRTAERAEPARRRRTVVVDLCCGSGAVGAALAATVDGLDVYAADLDPVAVRCAHRNLARHGPARPNPAGAGVGASAGAGVGETHVYQGDLYAALPENLRGRIDVMVANVPYVPTGEIALLPAEAREHEPYVALDGGADGLDVVRRVIDGAPAWLAPGGHLLIETSEPQASETLKAAVRAGLRPRTASSEEFAATVVIAVKPVPGKEST